MKTFILAVLALGWALAGPVAAAPGRSVAVRGPSPCANIALKTDFAAGVYCYKGTPYASVLAIPGATFARALPAFGTTLNGNLVSFASGVPRITNAGYLPEDTRTNLALWNADFTNAAWGNYWAGPTSRTANAATAPDGTLTATRLVLPANPGAQPPGVTQTIASAASGSNAAISVWLKGAVGGEQIRINFDDNGNGALVTLTTAWSRYTAAGIVGASGGRFELTNTITSATPTVYAWGAGFEAATYATSTILTTTAAVTRPADSLSIAGINFPAQGTVLADYTAPVSPNTERKYLYYVSETGNSRFAARGADTVATEPSFIVGDGTATSTLTPYTQTTGQAIRTAMAYDTTSAQFGASANGADAAAARQVTASLLANATLAIGYIATGGEQLNGAIKRIVIVPSFYTAAQRIAATQ